MSRRTLGTVLYYVGSNVVGLTALALTGSLWIAILVGVAACPLVWLATYPLRHAPSGETS